MKTTIDLPDELIEKAMIATSSKTKIEAINFNTFHHLFAFQFLLNLIFLKSEMF